MIQYFPLIYLRISHTLMSQCLVLMMHFITRAAINPLRITPEHDLLIAQLLSQLKMLQDQPMH